MCLCVCLYIYIYGETRRRVVHKYFPRETGGDDICVRLRDVNTRRTGETYRFLSFLGIYIYMGRLCARHTNTAKHIPRSKSTQKMVRKIYPSSVSALKKRRNARHLHGLRVVSPHIVLNLTCEASHDTRVLAFLYLIWANAQEYFINTQVCRRAAAKTLVVELGIDPMATAQSIYSYV